MTGGRRRILTAGERRLWAAVAGTVSPLPGKAAPDDPAPPPAPDPAPSSPGPAAAVPRAAPPARAAPPLAPIDRKTARALSRGRRRAEASLDLHGLDQAAAHAALIGFVRRAQADGRALVLIVTGKGGDPGADSAGWTSGRGVLRRLVPLWLAAPELSPVVLGFEPAGPRQGGAGALYVRVRRRGVRP